MSFTFYLLLHFFVLRGSEILRENFCIADQLKEKGSLSFLFLLEFRFFCSTDWLAFNRSIGWFVSLNNLGYRLIFLYHASTVRFKIIFHQKEKSKECKESCFKSPCKCFTSFPTYSIMQ